MIAYIEFYTKRLVMKEQYFLENVVEQVAEAMLLQIPCRRPINFQPGGAALLVLDMQKFFLSADSHAFVPSAVPIVSRINKLISAFNSCSLPVIFTRHINTDKDCKMMGRWWKDILRENSQDSFLCEKLNSTGAKIINKTQYDAFYNTDLDSYLKDAGVSTLVVTGVMTHLCCETTARSAFVRGYQVYFPVDTTATYNARYHQSSLLNLSHGFAHVVLSNDLIGDLTDA